MSIIFQIPQAVGNILEGLSAIIDMPFWAKIPFIGVFAPFPSSYSNVILAFAKGLQTIGIIEDYENLESEQKKIILKAVKQAYKRIGTKVDKKELKKISKKISELLAQKQNMSLIDAIREAIPEEHGAENKEYICLFIENFFRLISVKPSVTAYWQNKQLKFILDYIVELNNSIGRDSFFNYINDRLEDYKKDETTDYSSINRFQPKSNSTDLIGRTDALKRLNEFLKCDSKLECGL